MLRKINKKMIAIFMLIITLFSTLGSTVMATEISSAWIYGKGEMDYHLQYWNEERGGWYYVVCNPAVYCENGVEYPAYCLNSDLPRSN